MDGHDAVRATQRNTKVQNAYGHRLLLGRADPTIAELDAAGPAPAPGDGQVVVDVERVALTANNVTYAVLGDAFGYWRFFPAPGGHGIVPTWGFGTCTASSSDDVAVGERLWGFWPGAEQAVLTVGRADEDGFVDVAEHRAELPGFYNRYERAASTVPADVEQALAVHRPLFATGWLLARHVEGLLADGGRAVVSSASSRTAIATGWCVANPPPGEDVPDVVPVGLTSASRVDHCRDTGPWSAVAGYDEVREGDVAGLGGDGPAVFVDVRGEEPLRAAVHRALDGELVASLAVGRTSWDTERGAEVLPPQPELFFAPSVASTQAQQRGATAFRDTLEASLRAYLADPASDVAVTVVDGDDLVDAWRRLATNEVPPGATLVLEW